MGEEMDAAYARRVGERLRRVRKQQRLSLQAVEALSEQEFKASVLGAYERGERAISVLRLQRLAGIYNVPVDQLLPRDTGGPDHGWPSDEVIDLTDHALQAKVTFDLTRLDGPPGSDVDLVSRYLRMIQVQRQDFNGRVLTIRSDDLRALACLLDTQPELMGRRLVEMGVRA